MPSEVLSWVAWLNSRNIVLHSVIWSALVCWLATSNIYLFLSWECVAICLFSCVGHKWLDLLGPWVSLLYLLDIQPVFSACYIFKCVGVVGRCGVFRRASYRTSIMCWEDCLHESHMSDRKLFCSNEITWLKEA